MSLTRHSKALWVLFGFLLAWSPSSEAFPFYPAVTSPFGQVSRTAPEVASRSVPSILESTRARLLASLARGDIAGAITAYATHVGSQAPQWLRALHTAYSAKSQEVGRCQEVARIIHTAYSKLDKAPEFIAFKATANQDYITFDLPNGKVQTLTRTGYHIVVRVGDVIHDAYTGPLGMKMTDYLARLNAIEGVSWQRVTNP